MAGYGYTGYSQPKKPSLAMAASKYQDPFGLSSQAPHQAPISKFAVAPAPADPTGVATPAQPKAAPVLHGPTSERPLTPAPQAYDINTDPALQTITGLLGQSDQDAQTNALKQRQHLLLAYGDPTLARNLGVGEDMATAASQNPTSILKNLGQQRDKNVHDLTEYLNSNNLLYSGNRIVQEGQAASDYQNALAKAAGDVEGGLGQIDSNLAAALGANLTSRVGAISAASDRHKGETVTPKPQDPIVVDKTTQTPWHDPGTIRSDPAPTMISDYSSPVAQATLKAPTGPLNLPGGGGVADSWSLAAAKPAKPAPSVADLLKLLRG